MHKVTNGSSYKELFLYYLNFDIFPGNTLTQKEI